MYLMNQIQSQQYTILANTKETNIQLRSLKYPIIDIFRI